MIVDEKTVIPRCFSKYVYLEVSQYSCTRKYLCWCLFLIKLACSFIKKRFKHICFPVILQHFYKQLFYRPLVIFREMTSKFQGQFNFCRYEGLCPAAKLEIAVAFHWMLQNFSTVTFENNFRSCFQKENKEGGEDAKWPFWFQVFTFSRTVIYQVMKQSSFSTNFHTVEPFSLDCYPFL